MEFFNPHNYQRNALTWLIQRSIIDEQPGSALFLDPGMGKTALSLCWIRLLKKLGLAKKVLIVAPLRVVYSVWEQETQKWAQFKDLKCSIVHGTRRQRMNALKTNADLYLMNPEGVPWLQEHLGAQTPFDVLLIDESSKFKNWSAARTKALRKMLDGFKFRLILTGTPSPNGIADLFAQVFLLDQGEALGSGITKFRHRFFERGGYGGYKWIPKAHAQQLIEQKIQHLCYRLSAADHLDLPDCIVNDIWVTMPETVRRDYKRMERDMFLELDGGKELVAMNAGAKYISCRQMAGGSIYGEDRKPIELHRAKLEAVADLAGELQGKPLLIAYSFTHELELLRSAFPELKAIYGGTPAKTADRLINDWNRGDLRVLAVQPKSLSHGINMQSGPGRDIAWFGLTDSLEEYQQLNARIYRQGVEGTVRVHRILTRGTVDEAVVDRIESKDSSQAALLNALQQYRNKHEA